MNHEGSQDIANWVEDKKLAIRAIAPIHQLYVDQSVELLLFRRQLVDQGPIEILKIHQYGRQISQKSFGIADTLPLIEALSQLEICPSRIDIGRLILEWMESDQPKRDIKNFLTHQLRDHLDPNAVKFEPRDVVLYGFGRIGRLLARILIGQEGGGDALRLRAVVCRGSIDLEKRANLLSRDSVHGAFPGTIRILAEENAIVADGTRIQFISSDVPDQIDYESFGIRNALVIDNTGVWRDRAGLGKHLESKGVDRVLLTAPGKGDIPNIVYGVNNKAAPAGEKIFSAASCTTNAIVPPLKVLHDRFGIEYAHIETVHSYTNDQNLLDNFHPKSRRGRSAPLNMVLTETGAASAIAKALPVLAGRVTGNAVRVPTPNVSLAILHLFLTREASAAEVNESLRQASLGGPLASQIDYTGDEEVVSSDMVGNSHPAIVDSLATLTHGRHATVYVWYDNEYGYATQVVRVAGIISGVDRRRYY